MVSQAYYSWLAAGKPYGLILPAQALQRALRAQGLTVYDYPDDSHLKADPPEDHTPFSATGWPGNNARWLGRALDVMPRSDTAAGRAENAALARALIRDRNAGNPGVAWIKYLNWTDEQGVCRREQWMPGHVTRSSTDKGHIHISGRSDVDTDIRADHYDPFTTGGKTVASEWTATPPADPAKAPFLTQGTAGYAGQQRDTALAFAWQNAAEANVKVGQVLTEVTALRGVIVDLVGLIQSGGGTVDVAAILAGVDARLTVLAAEQRDAVADLGEGGAAQVRADA